MNMPRLLPVLCCAVYFFLLAPILVVVLASFNAGAFLTFPPQGLSLRWYRTFFHNAVFLRAFIESMEIAVAATSISAVIGTMAALFSMRTTPALANIVRLGMTLPLVLPEVLTAIGLLFFFYAMGIGVHYSVALLVGHVLLTLPFIYINVSTSLRSFDPSWELAARSLGASPFVTFYRVTMPLMKSGLTSGCLFGFIVSFDAFSTSFLLKDVGTATLPIQLFDYLRLNFTPEAAAVSTFSIIVTFLIVIMTKTIFGNRFTK
ncbi:ABC transporter permease [Komagataeibacter rhaeticus]|uniref:ABC transporter permease n=1 Tax=Komagataeibacter rhaeticus TaxID=215221 RepID=A0A181CAT2_9PROT|nr:ABC transporter permease [Komagataeibacter rhaeticus]ATU72762.1 ABC transporter permease [Komagataeibacter xylinus]QIP35433.1 ABC transporter permease [Komagataeibacter rhaeticus]QOC48002.1 ABC transporter permease [Komagataeibacter rhaeticus]WPP22533.1 ABC transporter permease [Komagataeibacter rhaeticus]SAY48664.1 Inner membrane ABC transporter permease protein YdcV [Komagataeibacter rhaeticus]